MRDPKDAMEFFGSEGKGGFGAKVLWIPGLVPCGSLELVLLGWQRLPFDQRLVKENL